MPAAISSAVNFYSNSADKFTNLNTVLNMMNLNMDPYVICEKDSTYYLDDTGFNSLVDISADFQSLSDDFSSFSQFKSSYARPIRDYDTPYSYIKTTLLPQQVIQQQLYRLMPRAT